jgi:hypothetical protein
MVLRLALGGLRHGGFDTSEHSASFDAPRDQDDLQRTEAML